LWTDGSPHRHEFIRRYDPTLEIACVLIYAIPRTAVLGAVLLTGYLGGAIATHVRIGDPSVVIPLVLGLCAWAGVYLRDERLRALLPWKRIVREVPGDLSADDQI
jgi:hypothetical protein